MRLIYFTKNGLPIRKKFKVAKELTALRSSGLKAALVSIEQYDRVVKAFLNKKFSHGHRSIYCQQAERVSDEHRASHRTMRTRGGRPAEFFGLSDNEISRFQDAVKEAGLSFEPTDFLIIVDHVRRQGTKRNEKVYEVKDQYLAKSEMTVLGVTAIIGKLKGDLSDQVVALWENTEMSFSERAMELEELTGKPVDAEAVRDATPLVNKYRNQLRQRPAFGD